MGITFRHRGNFNNMERFLKKAQKGDFFNRIENYAKAGVAALSSATPVDSGLTASSWTYEIEERDGGVSIHWLNTNVNKGVNIAIILQYGHGTRNGGYVAGRDYINPAIQPIMDEIAEKVWAEVKRS